MRRDTKNWLASADYDTVTPSQEHLDFIGKLNNASIPTRYPEDLAKTISVYPKAVAEHYLEKTKEVMAWLKQDPRLKKS